MEKLGAMHHSALAATKDDASVVVVVLEVRRTVIEVEETVLVQGTRAYHEARKIRTVRDPDRTNIVPVVKD